LSHFLFLLRHAKSDWKKDVATDFERPLSERGLSDAQKMANWMAQLTDLPTMIVSSPALRAYQTALIFAHALDMQPGDINFDKRIYAGSGSNILGRIKQFPETTKSILLVGHNPGFDSLLQTLCKTAEYRSDGKLMTTAAIAKVNVAGLWQNISSNSCELNRFTRPKELS
jgi:phosphohistidine phosphatase